jgi:hypothetical protein
LIPRSVKVHRAVTGLVDKPLEPQVMHLMIHEGRAGVAGRALPLTEEDLFATQLAFGRFALIEPSGGQQLGCGREVEHVLHLRHVTDLHTVDDVHALLGGADLVTVEVGRALLELGEVFDRAEAALGAVDLLLENAAQARGVQPNAPLLRPHVGIQMELSRRVAVDVTVEARDAEARVGALAVVGRVELLLRKRRDQHA